MDGEVYESWSLVSTSSLIGDVDDPFGSLVTLDLNQRYVLHTLQQNGQVQSFQEIETQ